MIKNIESFRPKLKKGRVIPRGSTFLFEIDDPYDQIVLPMQLADFVLLSGGQFNVREIIEKIYIKQGSVPFRAVFETIHLLHSRGFFENGDELEDASFHSGATLWNLKLFFDFKSSKRISMVPSRPALFYLLAVGVMLAAIFGCLFMPTQPSAYIDSFLRPDFYFSYLKLFAVSSVVLSAGGILKGAQTLFLTGRVCSFSFRVAPWGCYLKVNDEVSELLHNKLFAVVYYTSLIIFGLSFLPLASLLPGDALGLFTISATLIAFCGLNPFRNTEGYKLIRTLLIPSEIDPIFYFESEFIKKSRGSMRICALWGLVWIACGICLLYSFALWDGRRVIQDMAVNPTGLQIAAVALVALWLSSLYFIVHSFVESVRILVFHPLRLLVAHLQKSRFKKSKNYQAQDVVDKIRDLPLFTHFSDALLTRLVQGGEIIEVPSGISIITEGEPSKDLYVLLEGLVAVERQNLIGYIHPVTIFGEKALLDAQPREASVITQQKSVVLRIPEFLIKGVAQESQVVRELEHFMTAIMIDQFFASAPMFRKLPREGIEFLSSKGVLQYTGAGETVFSQGDPGDSFYMVIRGTVQVVLEGEMVKTISQGGFFGEIALIGNIPRTATIRAGEPTVLFKITSQAFWEVLVRYIEMAMFVESIGERRLYEDLQVMSKRRSAS